MLTLLLACAPADTAYLVGSAELVFEPALEFEPVGLDGRSTSALTLENAGHSRLTVALEVKGRGFAVDTPEIQIDPDAGVELELWFTPYGAAPAIGELLLISEVGTEVVALTGTTNTDADGDGHDHIELGGDDCDDTRADVHAGAEEVWYDGVDQDCLGGDDWDADGDGYAAEPEGLDCDDEHADAFPGGVEVWYDGIDQDCEGDSDFDQDGDGYDRIPEGDDCDDEAVRVNPGATEVWYDGLDADCSGGSDYDQDGDGVLWPEDCDDTDEGVGAC